MKTLRMWAARTLDKAIMWTVRHAPNPIRDWWDEGPHWLEVRGHRILEATVCRLFGHDWYWICEPTAQLWGLAMCATCTIHLDGEESPSLVFGPGRDAHDFARFVLAGVSETGGQR